MLERLEALWKDIRWWLITHLSLLPRAVVLTLTITLAIVVISGLIGGVFALWLGGTAAIMGRAGDPGRSLLGVLYLFGLPGLPCLFYFVYKAQPDLKAKRKHDEV